mmetsp:Transcript_33654/g.41420  ORF Transcript_33654/g.41420 Transcript_33654/m.41420 type:complete len:165 (-) Transcript_33654:218-712(-)
MTRSSRVVLAFVVALFAPWSLPRNFSVARKGTAPSDLEVPPMVGFGKYRDISMQELLAEDEDYCRWILDTYEDSEGDCIPKLKAAAEWIRENHPDLADLAKREKEKGLMGFGKHKDKTMDYVLENDADYADWVVAKFREGDAGKKLEKFAQFVLQKRGELEDEE